MDKLLIKSGRRLNGSIAIAGAKNAALPILAAGLLTADELIVRNVPGLADIRTLAKLISGMGAKFSRSEEGIVTVNASGITSPEAPYELVKTMRASILVLGPLLARFGQAKVPKY